jgi:hypothetical protein
MDIPYCPVWRACLLIFLLGIGEEGMHLLSHALRCNTHLRELDLSYNNICDKVHVYDFYNAVLTFFRAKTRQIVNFTM